MSELPRYSDRDEQRDVLAALQLVPRSELKRIEVLSSWPVTVRFNRISHPSAVILGGCWQRDDPAASPTVTGFLWVPVADGVSVTLAGPTADTMQVLTLVALGDR